MSLRSPFRKGHRSETSNAPKARSQDRERAVSLTTGVLTAFWGHLRLGELPGAEVLREQSPPDSGPAGRPSTTCVTPGLTLAAQSGATLAEVMRRAGHSSAAAAMRYQHAADQRDAEIAARLSALAAARRDRSADNN